MSQKTRHKEKLQIRAHKERLARGIASQFRKFCEDGMAGTRWDEDAKNVRKSLTAFLMQHMRIRASTARLLALASVTKTATRVAVDMQRLATMIMKHADRELVLAKKHGEAGKS